MRAKIDVCFSSVASALLYQIPFLSNNCDLCGADNSRVDDNTTLLLIIAVYCETLRASLQL